MTEIVFQTQRPRDDGCGAVTLQMLTGKSYDDLAPLFGWGANDVRWSDWNSLRHVLSALGWHLSEVTPVSDWDEIGDLAIIHVKDDHFMLYDGRRGLFYDPEQLDGPQQTCSRVPMSFAIPTHPS